MNALQYTVKLFHSSYYSVMTEQGWVILILKLVHHINFIGLMIYLTLFLTGRQSTSSNPNSGKLSGSNFLVLLTQNRKEGVYVGRIL